VHRPAPDASAAVRKGAGAIDIEATRRFRPSKDSVRAARSFVGASLSDWERACEVDIVVLLVSELVTNVVVHAGPHPPGQEIVVDLTRTLDLVRVGVTDWCPGPLVAGAGTTDKESGRGLLILDKLASAWGVYPTGSGKVVWFEVQA